jgi:hypothetical protein
MIRPSALGVARLTTNSNLVGCSTGRSAGFVPRIAVPMNGSVKLARCAIYTRKSTEHNLDLAFTSLDAQREAAERKETKVKWERGGADYLED